MPPKRIKNTPKKVNSSINDLLALLNDIEKDMGHSKGRMRKSKGKSKRKSKGKPKRKSKGTRKKRMTRKGRR
jgi:hypothetical protein